jgi:putative cell wall-binding protein
VHFDGPVVLIPGMVSSIDAATRYMFTNLGVDTIKIAGGTGVVSTSIEARANTIFGAANVTRYGGANWYSTSVLINKGEFTATSTVYLAQGSGFPGALAGAAVAGSKGAPLFVSAPDCIPAVTLEAIEALGATRITLLGGTGMLSSRVGRLTSYG